MLAGGGVHLILTPVPTPLSISAQASLFAILSLGGSACAVSHGSFARPVQAPAQGASLVGAGVMVPVVASEPESGSEGLSNLDDAPARGNLVPAASYDYLLSSRHTLGIEVAYADTENAGYVLVHPRWELGLNSALSLTGDLSVGFGSSEEGEDPVAQLSLTFGVRIYIPLGFGGFILSQQIGTGVVTAILPGSLAYDIPITLTDALTLHLFPEFRWDPTINFLIPSIPRYTILAAAGLSTMLEF